MDTARGYLNRKYRQRERSAWTPPPVDAGAMPAASDTGEPVSDQLSVSLCPHGLIHLYLPGAELQATLTPEQAGQLAMLLMHLERQAKGV